MARENKHYKHKEHFNSDTEAKDIDDTLSNDDCAKSADIDETETKKTQNVEAEAFSYDLDSVQDDKLREHAKLILNALSKENDELIVEQEELKKQIAKGDSYLNQLVVLKSDFENFKRRNTNSVETARDEGKFFVIEKLLPILDTFDKARQMLSATEMATFNLIVKQFEKILCEAGVEKMDILGQKFDPNTANAVHKIEVKEAEADDTVVEVYANGYKFKDKILRYATVCVGKFKEENNIEG